MGTHPIFESDFDCLTETMESLVEVLNYFFGPGYYHMIIEAGLVLCLISLFKTRPKRPKSTIVLTAKERQQLIDDWKPEPLVPEHPEKVVEEERIIDGSNGLVISVNGSECLNFGSYNFLNLLGHATIKETAKEAIKTYGVGSCGPRGFFGTFDAHLDLESKLAKFLGVEETILYSYGFSTIASAIPAYAKTGDVIFVDEKASFAIQQGVKASKSKVKYFKHNDMSSLESLLMSHEKEERKNPKAAKVRRKFIIAEALYTNTGEICPVDQLIKFKWRFAARIFLEESNSFGVLGATGKGITEHLNLDPVDIDLITAELERSVGSIGGFCAGTTYVIDHQRLSGAGYCFSASLPPYLARIADCAIDIMCDEPNRLSQLRDNCHEMHNALAPLTGPLFQLTGDRQSPIKHLMLSKAATEQLSVEEIRQLFKRIIDHCEATGIAIVRAMKVPADLTHTDRSIRITVSSGFTVANIAKCAEILQAIITQIDIPL